MKKFEICPMRTMDIDEHVDAHLIHHISDKQHLQAQQSLMSIEPYATIAFWTTDLRTAVNAGVLPLSVEVNPDSICPAIDHALSSSSRTADIHWKNLLQRFEFSSEN